MKDYRTDRVTQEVCKDPVKLAEYLTRREEDIQKALRSTPRRYVEYSVDITSTATAYQFAHPFGNSAVRWWVADVVLSAGSSGLIAAHRTALDASTIALTMSTQPGSSASVVVHLEAADG